MPAASKPPTGLSQGNTGKLVGMAERAVIGTPGSQGATLSVFSRVHEETIFVHSNQLGPLNPNDVLQEEWELRKATGRALAFEQQFP
jgi:hypothetical protein